MKYLHKALGLESYIRLYIKENGGNRQSFLLLPKDSETFRTMDSAALTLQVCQADIDDAQVCIAAFIRSNISSLCRASG